MAQFNLSTVCLLILLSLNLFSMQAHAACCTTHSKGKLPIKFIRGFSIQDNHGRCNINAIIFLTYKGRRVCVDPTKGWVMDSIRQLRNKVEKMNKTGNPTRSR
ncbi:hypothetical protein SKAU_G00198320 [Synaphobranchus kaupii]|uniref:C-C motif chemokine n=1 Tax=Synaphobranchus kaupii TaxID=118154 RepID=A0A9Q1IXY6_SYNKA|nr:hypothetical protein SKAU_G00198320 [Synaphobranchus kaupii]